MAAETQSWQASLLKSSELKGADEVTMTNEEPKMEDHEEDIDDKVRNLLILVISWAREPKVCSATASIIC